MGFPLNPPEVGRSQFANPRPLAPHPEAGVQTDPFGGIREPYESYAEPSFREGMDEAAARGARHQIRETQIQSRDVLSAIAPEVHSSPYGGYVIPPAVLMPDAPIHQDTSEDLGPTPPDYDNF